MVVILFKSSVIVKRAYWTHRRQSRLTGALNSACLKSYNPILKKICDQIKNGFWSFYQECSSALYFLTKCDRCGLRVGFGGWWDAYMWWNKIFLQNFSSSLYVCVLSW